MVMRRRDFLKTSLAAAAVTLAPGVAISRPRPTRKVAIHRGVTFHSWDGFEEAIADLGDLRELRKLKLYHPALPRLHVEFSPYIRGKRAKGPANRVDCGHQFGWQREKIEVLPFGQLKKGDVFHIVDADGSPVMDRTVCIALEDAQPASEQEGFWKVRCSAPVGRWEALPETVMGEPPGGAPRFIKGEVVGYGPGEYEFPPVSVF